MVPRGRFLHQIAWDDASAVRVEGKSEGIAKAINVDPEVRLRLIKERVIRGGFAVPGDTQDLGGGAG